MFKDRMDTSATPERVYVLCSCLLKGPQNRKSIKSQMEPEYLNQNTIYFDTYVTAAIELGLITDEDNFLKLAVDSETLNDMNHMRSFINNEIGVSSLLRNGIFFKVTEMIFKMDDWILKTNKSLSEIAPDLDAKLDISIKAEYMRAWRFWSSYLGFGYLFGKDGMNFIPNSCTFLESLIAKSSLEVNKTYSISDFLNQLSPNIDILGVDFERKYLNYGISNGLRTLNSLNKIKLQNVLDENDIWSIYEIQGDVIKDTVTGISILSKE